MILAARQEVTRTVDAGLVTLYWHIGQRVRHDILQLKRAEYGGRIVSALGRQLAGEFGRGFILCVGKRDEHIELLEPSQSGIHVASYLTQLLPKSQLKRKLHESVEFARARSKQHGTRSVLESR